MRGLSTRLWIAAYLAMFSAFFFTTAARAAIISADFENSTNSVTFTGVEPLAQSANSIFGASNTWNSVKFNYLSPVTNPSFSALKDSGNAATSIGLSFTGTIDSFTATTASNNLFKEFLFLNSGSVDWKLTGLPVGIADLYLYNYGDASQSYRQFNMLIDKDGNGSLETTASVDAVNGVYVAGIQVSPTGEINGRMVVTGGQASWSGFQISVPEPASLGLIGLSVVGLIVRRRR